MSIQGTLGQSLRHDAWRRGSPISKYISKIKLRLISKINVVNSNICHYACQRREFSATITNFLCFLIQTIIIVPVSRSKLKTPVRGVNKRSQ